MPGYKPTLKDLDQSTAFLATPDSIKAASTDIQFAFAQNSEQQGDPDAAIKTYKKVLEIDPTFYQAYHRLGLLHDKQGKSHAAVAYYAEAARLAPKVPELQCDWGYNCYLLGQWEEAKTHYYASLNLKPDFERAHNNLALVLARQGQLNEALNEFAHAGASEAEARSNVAFAMMLDGQLEPAQQQLNMVHHLPPENTTQAAELQRIANIATTGNVHQTAAQPYFVR